jgi:hypothetical protein
VAHANDVLAIHPDPPGARELFPDQEADEAGLAGARRPDEENEVTRVDLEVDIAKRVSAVGIALADIFEGDQFVTPPRVATIPGRAPGKTSIRSKNVPAELDWDGTPTSMRRYCNPGGCMPA